MWPDWVSNLGPLALESDALPTALRGPAPQTVGSFRTDLLHVSPGKLQIFMKLCHLNPKLD